MDPVSYAVLPGKEDVVILGNPTLATLVINVQDNLANARASVSSPSRVWNRHTSRNFGR